MSAAFLRKRIQSHFVQIPNATARDKNLSFRAVGVLTHLLSLPDDSPISSAGLAATHSEGRDAVRTALAELEAAGYYHVERLRSPDGTFRTHVTVSNVPGEPDVSASPAKADADFQEQPGPENPTSVEPTSDSQAVKPKEQDLLPSVEEQRPQKNNPSRADDAFDAFWTSYPRKVAKPAARTAFARALKRANVGTIMAGLERHRPSMEARVAAGEPQYVCHPVTWLNQDRWDDEPPPMPNGRRPSGPPANGGVRQVKPRDAWEDPDIMEDPFA